MATVSIAGYTADLDYARIVHINNPKFKYVRSFKIIETQDRAVWTLTINQSVLVGQYPTQAAAIGALVGCIIHRDGDLEGAEASITDMLSRGSTIDPDINILTLATVGDPVTEIAGTLDLIDYTALDFAGEPYFAYQNSIDGQVTWGVNGVASAVIEGNRIIAVAGGSQTDTFIGAYGTFAENSAMRAVLLDGSLNAYTDPDYTISLVFGNSFAGETLNSGVLFDNISLTNISSVDGAAQVLTLTFTTNAAALAWQSGGGQYVGVTQTIDASSFAVTSNTATVTAPTECAAIIAEGQGNTISVTLSKTEYTVSSIVSNVIYKDAVNDLTLTLEISGESTAGAPVEIGGFAYAIPTFGGVPEGQSYSLTYAWSREIPLLNDLVISGVSAVAPTLTASGDQAADSLTVGDTASITASATGNPTPTISYQWKVDAVNSGSDQATFDTSGLSGGEALTCVVTASNGVSPDDTATISFGTVAAAAGPTLIIHDAFDGTGGLSGRTPDTVDNGNTWTIESGTSYTVTGGNTYPISGVGKSVTIDCGSSNYEILMIARASTTNQTRNGVVTHYIDDDNYVLFTVNASGLILRERSSGINTDTVLVTPVVLNANAEQLWTVEITGTSYSVALERTTGTPSFGPVTGTVSLTTTTKVGMWWSDNGFDQYITDFKVYA
jgi:hypothetical protein